MGDAVQDQISFSGLDEHAFAILRRVKPVVMAALPGILDRFYQKTAAFPQLAGKFSGPDRIRALKAAQVHHWARLFDGKFDDDFKKEAEAIGAAHSRFGLDPDWYISGYAMILGDLLAVVREQEGLTLTKSQRGRSGETVSVVGRAVLLDINFSLSAPWVDQNASRTGEIEQMIEAINDQVLDTVASVGQYTKVLLDSAGEMATVGVAVDEKAHSAASASDSTLQSAQTVAAAAEELHASIAEISQQVTRSSTTAQNAVAWRRPAVWSISLPRRPTKSAKW